MCLGVPGRVIEVRDGAGIVDFWGVRKLVRLDIVDEPVQPGDYVLTHVGFAIRRIPESDIAETLRLYEDLLAGASTADLMAQDVSGELSASSNREPGARGERP